MESTKLKIQDRQTGKSTDILNQSMEIALKGKDVNVFTFNGHAAESLLIQFEKMAYEKGYIAKVQRKNRQVQVCEGSGMVRFFPFGVFNDMGKTGNFSYETTVFIDELKLCLTHVAQGNVKEVIW